MAESLRYLYDNLKLFHADKIAGAPYGGAPLRLSGDERQLIADVLEYLNEQLEQRSRGGLAARGNSGRPRLPDAEVSDAALYQRERRKR